jgi:hypothetical protein
MQYRRTLTTEKICSQRRERRSRKRIGKREIIRRQVSQNRPAGFSGAAKRSETTSNHHVTEDAVMASVIEQLPDLA